MFWIKNDSMEDMYEYLLFILTGFRGINRREKTNKFSVGF